MNIQKSSIYSAIVLLMIIWSCGKNEPIVISDSLHPIELKIPSNFPKPTLDVNNPLTTEGIALGRLLFYDVRLSGNNSISCASCHRPELAFTDAVPQTNIGFTGIPLPRNASALINLAWANNGLHWDGITNSLQTQALLPLTDLHEMNEKLPELEAELKRTPDYVTRFRKAFNDDIKAELIAKALAQFQKTLISGDSKYDQFVRKENNVSLSALELQGLNLVKQKCSNCHAGELFTDNEFHNNGLDATFTDQFLGGVFLGRFRVTKNVNDLGKFKTPTLRNAILTEPYMHDGRFITLAQVLDHYANGVKSSPSLDASLVQMNGKVGITLTTDEKTAIIAFLTALTDYKFASNKDFSNPN
jgi:cytochrome c peroxidase